ncbi:MAG TPA: hypothetical protein VFB80_20315, partial [Pirellulaceae bacterium]|nr:hypothetical protein [Pirellulaceae bacterium]
KLAGSAAASLVALPAGGEQPASKPRVAAVFTEFRRLSHAYHILGNAMGKYLFRGQWVDPGLDVVSFYADQFPAGDMARDVSQKFKVPLFKSIDEALCVGGRELAVDAVLLIGEHGRYPANELGQRMYPRKEFFDQIVAVQRRAGRFVPVFNDKHLSYRWDWAKAMYDEAQRLKMPLMAGSSVPLAQRMPPLELPPDAAVIEAVSIHGGGVEGYDFHALEVMQSLIEARAGGETGVSRVEFLTGEALQRAAAEGRWPTALVAAAMRAERDAKMPRRSITGRPPRPFPDEPFAPRHAILVTYNDGTRGTVLTIGRSDERWNFACQLRGDTKPLATSFYGGPWGNWNLFGALGGAIAHFFRTGKAPYPVERTLLVSGILDAAMHSRHAGGQPQETPHLKLKYAAQDFRAFCETGESWQVLTTDSIPPQDFQPGSG